MSKSLSVATTIEKNRLASDVPFLVCLDIGVVDPATLTVVETLHYVNNTVDITFNGNTYTALPFNLKLKSEANAQNQINLDIKDYSRAVQARMQSYGGGIGFQVTITVVNAAALTSPPEIVEQFEVVGASAANYTATFMLGAENALAKSFPRRRQTRDYCQWRYKDANCTYAGGLATCDLSFEGPNGCSAHSNSVNFGGFPGINSNGSRYA